MSQQRPNARRTSKRPTVVRGEQKQVNGQSEQSSLQSIRPSNDDRAAWLAYWQERNQPWRIEPEISPERQAELEKRRALVPDVKRGIYPFKGMKLDRADVEWLLATHEGGPINWSDEKERGREGLDVRGANLCDADLHGLPLTYLRGGLANHEGYKIAQEHSARAVELVGRDFDFSRAAIKAMELGRAGEAGAQLQGANLSGARLDGASLLWANLQGANLSKARLQNASLIGAQLQRANLSEARLERADLLGANLQEAKLNGIRLEGASLRGAQLQRSDLECIQLQGVDLSEAQLQEANLSEAQLQEADLIRADLSRAKLIGAQMQKIHLFKAQLQEADLSGADLSGANLMEAQLKKVNLEEAKLRGASIGEADLEGANLRGAQLREADLSEAHLESTNFSEAQLQGANLRKVNLGDKQRIGPRLADLQWGDTYLAVVDWSQVAVLGDEHQARQKQTPDGKKKDFLGQAL